MSEEQKFDQEETEDVEAHKKRAFTDDANEQESDEDESDDVEAHRRRA